jgi:excisionase family DNA binding protein
MQYLSNQKGTTVTPQTLEKDWLTRKEAAEYLSVTPQKVSELVNSGKLHGTKLGDGPNSPLRISSDSIERMLKNRGGRNGQAKP